MFGESIETKYLVYPDGRIYSNIRHRFLRPNKTRDGYLQVTIHRNDGSSKTSTVHRLVAMLFVMNPDMKTEVNHIDGNKLNNHYTNLEWCTKSENSKHAVRLGLITPPKNKWMV